jgi:hypothetical protein
MTYRNIKDLMKTFSKEVKHGAFGDIGETGKSI